MKAQLPPCMALSGADRVASSNICVAQRPELSLDAQLNPGDKSSWVTHIQEHHTLPQLYNKILILWLVCFDRLKCAVCCREVRG